MTGVARASVGRTCTLKKRLKERARVGASAIGRWGTMRGVGFKDLRRRLTTSVAQLDQARLQERYDGLGVTPIDTAPTRTPIRIGGEVKETRVVPRAGSPSLEVTLSDGTGRAIAVFTGTKKLGGLNLGGGVLLEGVARHERGRLILLNPAYTLLGH